MQQRQAEVLQLSFVEFKKGAYILVDGAENSERFFIIQSGKVSYSNSLDPGKNATKILTTGDFVGVIPCMSCHSQIENAIALTDVKCISVPKGQYPELIAKNIPVALKIIRTFATRTREMNEQLTQLTLKNVSQDTPEHIFDVAQFYDKTGRTDIATYAYYRYLKECPKGAHTAFAQKRFVALKPASKAVYFEPTEELVRRYPQETMIMSESQSGSEMFVIQDGQVSISKVVDGNEVILAVLKKGDMFGEMAILENKPRSASAIAHQDCVLMVINRSNFNQMVSSQPQLITRLTTTLAERLWSMYRQLGNTCLREPMHKVIDMLALQLEKTRRFSGSFQTDYSVNDIINMCGIPQQLQPQAYVQIHSEPSIKIVQNKIFVPDCAEIIKAAAFFRKQEATSSKSQGKPV